LIYLLLRGGTPALGSASTRSDTTSRGSSTSRSGNCCRRSR